MKPRKPLPPPFDGKTPPLTAKALARRIAREQLRRDRRTAGLPPSKARKPLPSKTLADHERRIREIEDILFGKGLKALRSTLPPRPPSLPRLRPRRKRAALGGLDPKSPPDPPDRNEP